MTRVVPASRRPAGSGRDPRPAQPVDGPQVLVVYVPAASTEGLLAALFAAGAGAIGAYRECAWVTSGVGRFRPLPGATPTLGEVGELVTVQEDRCDLVVPRGRRDAVIAALRAAHPYEEPAFHLIDSAPLG